MKKGDTIFCKDESVYEEHISKGNAYTVIDKKKDEVRVQGHLRNRLVWIPRYCFSKKPVVGIKKIRLDCKIRDPLNDCIDVTIKFDNGKRRWAWFTTLKYLDGLMNEHRNYFAVPHIIILKAVTRKNIEFAIMDLYRQNELKESTRKH